MTQISRQDPPSRGNSQKQFAVVVQIGKLEFQPQSNGGKLWKNNNSNEKVNKFWEMLRCIRSGSPKNQIKTECCLSSPRFPEQKANVNRRESLNSNGNPAIPENLPMNHVTETYDGDGKKITRNNMSNSSLRDSNCEDLHAEMRLNMLDKRGDGSEGKALENSAFHKPFIGHDKNDFSSFI